MKFLIYLVLYIFLFVNSSVLLQSISSSIVKVLVILSFCAIQIATFKKLFPVQFQSFFLNKSIKLKWVIFAILTPLLSLLFMIIAIDYYYSLKKIELDTSNLVGNILGMSYIGITEEILGRGVIFIFLLQYSKKLYFSIIVSSLFFGLMHGFGVPLFKSPGPIIYYFTMGFTFCVLFISSRSIWIISTIHFIFNLLWQIFDFDTEIVIGDIYQINLVIPVILPFIILSILLLFFNYKYKHNEFFLGNLPNR